MCISSALNLYLRFIKGEQQSHQQTPLPAYIFISLFYCVLASTSIKHDKRSQAREILRVQICSVFFVAVISISIIIFTYSKHTHNCVHEQFPPFMTHVHWSRSFPCKNSLKTRDAFSTLFYDFLIRAGVQFLPICHAH